MRGKILVECREKRGKPGQSKTHTSSSMLEWFLHKDGQVDAICFSFSRSKATPLELLTESKITIMFFIPCMSSEPSLT